MNYSAVVPVLPGLQKIKLNAAFEKRHPPAPHNTALDPLVCPRRLSVAMRYIFLSFIIYLTVNCVFIRRGLNVL